MASWVCWGRRHTHKKPSLVPTPYLSAPTPASPDPSATTVSFLAISRSVSHPPTATPSTITTGTTASAQLLPGSRTVDERSQPEGSTHRQESGDPSRIERVLTAAQLESWREKRKGRSVRFRSIPPDVIEGDPFANDALGRRGQIEALTRLICRLEGPCVLALDGTWGSGKTVFLEMWASVLRGEDYDVVQFNAWDTDFSDDPLMALQAEMTSALKSKPNYQGLLKAGATVVSSVAGLVWPVPDPMKTLEEFKEQMATSTTRRIEQYRTAREDITKFRQALTRTIGPEGRLVICVDELDRCRPDYAIRFLEATKHVFEVDGVTFLLAVNFSELANSVRTLYGTDFDGEQYLRRFVDHILYLQTDRTRYLQHLVESTGLDRLDNPYFSVSEYLDTFIFKVPNISLRDLEHAITHLGLVLNALHPMSRDTAMSMMILRIVVPDTYRQLITGAISDADALQALNRRINRSDKWWQEDMDTYSLSNRRVNVLFENTLICLDRYTTGAGDTASPLMEKRQSEMADEESGPNYPSQVVSRLTQAEGPEGIGTALHRL